MNVSHYVPEEVPSADPELAMLRGRRFVHFKNPVKNQLMSVN